MGYTDFTLGRNTVKGTPGPFSKLKGEKKPSNEVPVGGGSPSNKGGSGAKKKKGSK
jgi:hypothetical protein